MASALPPAQNTTFFPTGTFVIPMDEKQAERVLVFGFVHTLLRSPNPIQIFRVIEPPDVTFSTNITSAPAVFAGGPFLVYSSDASKIIQVKGRPEFKRVTLGMLTAQQSLSSVSRVGDPPKILVVKGLWGRTDIILDAMKIPYNSTTREEVAANPSVMSGYSLIVVDSYGWNGNIPSQVADKLRSHASQGNEVLFTDIAMRDLDQTFPGYVSLSGPQLNETISYAYAYNPPRRYDAAKYGVLADRLAPEFLSQYYNRPPHANEIKSIVPRAGYVVSSASPEKTGDVRVLVDSVNLGLRGDQYGILAFYFGYGDGIVEGIALLPQQQTKYVVGDSGYYAVNQLYGNMFVYGPKYPSTCTLNIGLAPSKLSFIVGETVSFVMSSNVPADYLLTIKKPDGTIWASESGTLPNTFSKIATEPAGTYTADLSAHYCDTYAYASASFTVKLGTYDVVISLAGLPADATTALQVDGSKVADMKGNDERVLTYPNGTSHAFRVDQYVNGATGSRYYCASNTWVTNTQASNGFTYVIQYRLTVAVSPSDVGSVSLNPSSPDGWYNATASTQATATLASAYAGKYVFDHWELDGTNVNAAQLFSVNMNSPHTLTAVFRVLATQTTTVSTQTVTATTVSTEATLHTTTTETTSESSTITEQTTTTKTGGEQAPTDTLVIAGVVFLLLSVAGLVTIFLRRMKASRPSPRICKHCGFSNPPFTKAFCVKCGKPLEAA